MTTSIPWPPRPLDGHKGTFGTVLVVGGSLGQRGMLGGPTFSALGALRAGCGLCELAMPAPLLVAGLSLAPSATGVALPVDGRGTIDAAAAIDALRAALDRATVLAIGPGLGEDHGVEDFVQALLAAAVSRGLPVVLDADGLNAYARFGRGEAFATPTIATPHPGEFRRLAESCGLGELDPVDPARRPESARVLAARLRAIVILKGQGTCVAMGDRVEVERCGNPALATGGSGDVLTGVVASLWAQWIASKGPAPITELGFEAARAAVQLHGHAADRWAREHGDAGMLASDLLAAIPDARRALSAS
ncbi:MAG: NAD(P)H-hydrate dehydratase [Phycisphaerales bacterium]|jgi:ADP-dependent NAD(P)H-hydrate dehydratase